MRNLIISIIFLCISANVYAVGPEDLIYMTEEYPPYNYTEEGNIKGVSVEILRLMWKDMGCTEQDILVYPWARGYKAVQERDNHVLFAMSRTEAREDMFKWVGPLYEVKFVLLGLADSDFKIDSLDDAKEYSIGCIREDVSEQVLKEKGFSDNLESVTDMSVNMEKLLKNRIDLVAYSDLGFNRVIKKGDYNPELFKIYYVMEDGRSSYYAYNKNIPDSLIHEFQLALDNIKGAGLANEIIEKYFNK